MSYIIYTGEGFYSSLDCHRKSRSRISGAYGDIHNGDVYEKLESQGFFSDSSEPANLSFIMNTDGVPVFKSSKYAFWPIYLLINELPYKKRHGSNDLLKELCFMYVPIQGC